jgi:pre-mRNA-processing factor SLU7
MGHKKK